jgi:hypothetical protein
MPRNKYYSSYSLGRSQPRSWLRTGLLIVLVGIPLGLLLLELLVRGVVFVTGTSKQLEGSLSGSAASAYALKLEDASGKSYPGLTSASAELQVRRSPLLGYELVPNQKHKFWQIDRHGFRQDADLPLVKPKGEFRIFVIGNSTAFSQMATSNQATLAAKLQVLLQDRLKAQIQNPEKFKPTETPYFAEQVQAIQALPDRLKEGSYRVITAATPGYTSGNELALLVHRVMAFSPDCVIILNGYEDLRSPSTEVAREVVNFDRILQNPSEHYGRYISQQFDQWFSSLYLVKATRRWVFPTSDRGTLAFKADQFTTDDQELKMRIDRYRYNLKQVAKLTSGTHTLVAIQPEITGKKSVLTADESKILKDLGTEYPARVENAFKELEAVLQPQEPKKEFAKVKIVNLYKLYKDYKEQAFLNPIDLNDPANAMLAKKLYEQLEVIFAVQPAPFSTTEPGN